jgi:hypothetical protein
MRIVRVGVSIVAGAALVPLSAAAAFAAPPVNDTYDGAITLSLGDTVTQDTTQATTDAFDAKLNRVCGAPFTKASVWYSYSAAEDGSFVLDMSKSDYTGGFMVFEGVPSTRSMVGCGPESIGIESQAGTTYFIMVFSDTRTKGGNLKLSLEEGPPAPTLDVTVNSRGKAYADGTASVGGTFTCLDAQFLDLEGQLTQIWKRVKITGYFYAQARARKCDGQPHAWRKLVTSDNGLYAPGEATVNISTLACGEIFCSELDTASTVTLRDGGQKPPAGLTSGSAATAPARPPAVASWP